jgi:hypothetical protein
MRILPFRRSPVVEAVPPAQDWSQQELADFYRAHRLLLQNGVSIGMDRGTADDGAPWMAFFDVASHDVFLHIARIDGRCVLVCETLGINLGGKTVPEIINAFEADIRQLIQLRQEKSSNVLLHPAARIVMSISAVFLLFKLENSGTAQAKAAPLGDTALGSSEPTRKQDLSASARVQQALSRLFDIADTPAAAAAIAGAILTFELARSEPLDQNQQQVALAQAQAHPELLLAVDFANSQATHAETAAAQAEAARADSGATVVAAESMIDLDARVEIALAVKALPIAAAAAAVQMAMVAPEHVAAEPVGRSESEEEPLRAASSTATSVATGGGSPSASTGTSDAVNTIVAATTTPTETTTLAAKIMQPLLLTSHELAASNPVSTDLPEVAAAVTIAVEEGVGDISVATLDHLGASAGLFRETALTGDILTSTLSAFMAHFGTYDVEIDGDRFMIEQNDTSLLGASGVGIWTNVMADGSEITVVGHLAVMTDLTTGLI